MDAMRRKWYKMWVLRVSRTEFTIVSPLAYLSVMVNGFDPIHFCTGISYIRLGLWYSPWIPLRTMCWWKRWEWEWYQEVKIVTKSPVER